MGVAAFGRLRPYHIKPRKPRCRAAGNRFHRSSVGPL